MQGRVEAQGRVVQRCSTEHGLMLKETWEYNLWVRVWRAGFLQP